MPKLTILITMGTIIALCVLAQVFALNDVSPDSKLQQFSKEISKL